MPKTFNIVTNLTNGAGLEREYRFLRTLLESYGHTVNGVPFRGSAPIPDADVNIFDEVVVEDALDHAKENWLMPHCEWYYANAWDKFLPSFSKILCKTKDCYRIFKNKVSEEKCVYTGFESLDLFRPIEKKRTFLHVPGGSRTRQTDMVARAWSQYKIPHQLTVVSRVPEIVQLCLGIPNVTVRDRVPDAELVTMMNENRFIIAPSKYEGFGHLIHEAIGCGAVVLTTDAAPMNEFNGIDPECLIRVDRCETWQSAVANIVSPQTVADAVYRVSCFSDTKLDTISRLSQFAFVKDRSLFRDAFAELMEPFA